MECLQQMMLNTTSSSSATPTKTIHNLPDEIVIVILKMCNLHDVLRFRSTCSKYRQIALEGIRRMKIVAVDGYVRPVLWGIRIGDNITYKHTFLFEKASKY